MRQAKTSHPQWALDHKRKGTELRCINGKYYLYEVTSKWDSAKKRSVKITGKLLGRITEADGFIESEKARLRTQQTKIGQVQVKEYGVTDLLETTLLEPCKRIKEYFPQSWQTILALSYGRLVHCSPLKNMHFHYSHSYLSELYPSVDLSGKSLSSFLKNLGTDRNSLVQYFRSVKHPGDCILFDGTDIFSHSENLSLPKLSKSKTGTFDTLINMMCIFSTKEQLPVYYRLLPGNIKDVSSFKLCLLESGIKDATVIIDKGFASKSNIEALEDEELNFIIPLPRNSSYIDYGKILESDKRNFDGYFKHENRFIWYYSYAVDKTKKVTVYLDENLRTREEQDYLNRIDSQNADYTIEKFHEKQHTFGTIAIIENTQKQPQTVYADYKTRGQVETMIDALKNVVEADRTYMQNPQTLEGWMFINHIALQWYYHILHLLKQHDLNKKYTPKDLLMMLAEIKKVKINNQWFDAETTKKITELRNIIKTKPIT